MSEPLNDNEKIYKRNSLSMKELVAKRLVELREKGSYNQQTRRDSRVVAVNTLTELANQLPVVKTEADVEDAASNLVNDANWQPLAVGTHYLNLDAVGARYCCPRWMWVEPKPAEPEPQPEFVAHPDEPAPSGDSGSATSGTIAIRVGDRVRPTRLIDYDGTPLTQWDDNYEVVEVIGNRAVLSARGQIWAAMRVGDVVKV